MKTDIMELLAFATQAVKKLVAEGYIAYFAGGWVRDYLMDHPSSDIDIATNAPPEVIIRLFPNTIHVGAAFGVYIIPYKGTQIEIATFRRDVEYLDGRKPQKIEPATPEEDAQRRDFTINGMFYDPINDVVHDWVHGAEDIKKGIIRAIGDPDQRFFEDRLRMVRAVRFATRFNFVLDPDTQQAIIDNAETLFPAVSIERIWNELLKMSHYPHFDHTLIELHQLHLLGEIFPELKSVHLNTIKERVAPFKQFPPHTPLVAFLVQLFPDKTEEEMEQLFRDMKVSVKDIKIAQFLIEGEAMIQQPELFTSWDWAHFYAHPHSALSLQIESAKHEAKQTAILQAAEKRTQLLKHHIERIQQKKPLVTSRHLIEHGITPGAKMGELLREAEKFAINEDHKDPEEVIIRLKQTVIWKGES